MEFNYHILKASLLGKEKPIACFSVIDNSITKTGCYTNLDQFSKESFEEGLNEVILELKNNTSLSSISINPNLTPSVRFFFLSLLNEKSQIKAKTAGLVFNPNLEKIKAFLEEGFHVLKLKFRKFDEETKNLLDSIFLHFPDVKFRLDFNQNLSKAQTFCLINSLDLKKIDFIEEPGTEVMPYLADLPSIFAFDESLRNQPNFPLTHNATYVIKPCLHPKFDHVISKLSEMKKRVIISSSFEMPQGLNYLHQLVFDYGLDQDVHGLDTLRYYDALPTL